MPVLVMIVADNIFLYDYPVQFVMVNKKILYQKTDTLFAELGIEGISPGSRMRSLSQAQMQMVEIVKAVSAKSDIIIMDEPTSSITENEVEKLFRIIDTLKQNQVSVMYISHKMDEIFQICDDVTVLRYGQYIDCKPLAELDRQKIISMMVGRELPAIFPQTDADGA